jgi:hypothetical protein
MSDSPTALRRVEITVYTVWFSESPSQESKPGSDFDTEEEAERIKKNLEQTVGNNGQRLYFNVEGKPERRVKLISPPSTGSTDSRLGAVNQVPGRPAIPQGKYTVSVFKSVNGNWASSDTTWSLRRALGLLWMITL